MQDSGQMMPNVWGMIGHYLQQLVTVQGKIAERLVGFSLDSTKKNSSSAQNGATDGAKRTSSSAQNAATDGARRSSSSAHKETLLLGLSKRPPWAMQDKSKGCIGNSCPKNSGRYLVRLTFPD